MILKNITNTANIFLILLITNLFLFVAFANAGDNLTENKKPSIKRLDTKSDTSTDILDLVIPTLVEITKHNPSPIKPSPPRKYGTCYCGMFSTIYSCSQDIDCYGLCFSDFPSCKLY